MLFKPAGGRKTRGDKSAAPAARDEINKSGSAELCSMDDTDQIPAKRYSRKGSGSVTPYASTKIGFVLSGFFCQGKIGFVFSNAEINLTTNRQTRPTITDRLRFLEKTNHWQPTPQTRHPARI